MARYLRITTPYGDGYFIHENGFIERADGMNGPGSESWTFQGVTLAARDGGFISFTDLTPDVIDGLKTASPSGLCYPNGTPKYTVVDNDHGTRRVWGNTDYHGIATIDVLDRGLVPVTHVLPTIGQPEPEGSVVHELDFAFALSLYQKGPNNFSVVYGQQVKTGLTYAQAAQEYGECIFHALAYDGLLDNSEAGT